MFLAASGASIAVVAGGASAGAATSKAVHGKAAASLGGTLRLSFYQPLSLNPALGGTAESDVLYGALAYDSLTYQTGPGSFIPDLATKWSYAGNSNNKIFDITLRAGVHFSDGSLMTPKSVINSFMYFKKAGGQNEAYLAKLASAKVTGAHTLSLHFASPQPDLQFLFSQWQDAGQIIGPKGIADPTSLAVTSDGTGPYVLSKAQSVANSNYVYNENTKYWNKAAIHYKAISVKVVTDPQTAESAVESGQLDGAFQLPTALQSAAKSQGLQTYAQPFAIASLMLIDRAGTISPLGNLDVRQALNMAVDRTGLSKALFGTDVTDEFVEPGTPGWDPKLADKYAYNVTKAKQLLAAGGYANGFTLPVLDTDALDPNGDIAAALKSQLAAIGVTLDITETAAPPQFVPLELSKKYAAIVWPISNDGAGFPYAVDFAMVGSSNAFNSTNSTLTHLENVANAASGAQQTTDFVKVNDWLTNNAWFVPLFGLGDLNVIGKDVGSVQAPSIKNTTLDPISPVASKSWAPKG